MSHVAVLGTGLLGAGFVEALRARGVPVRVWNRSLDKARALEADGVSVATDPADAVRGAERVHLVLADDAAVNDVLDRAWPALTAQVIDHSTVSPAGVVRRTQRFAAAGRSYVHAPVFMGPKNARDATGMILLSGPPAVIQPVAELLRPMTGNVIVVGERIDQAAVLKLLGNGAAIGMVAAMADVLALGRANGLDESAILAFFAGFDPMGSVRARSKRIAERDWRPASFTLDMARKDVRLMVEAAGDTELFVLPAIATRMDAAIAAGDGDADFAVMGRPSGPKEG